MNNRFTLKDLIFATLLVGVLVAVLLSMMQFDRQWEEVQTIKGKLDDQQQALARIADSLKSGISINTGTGGTSTVKEDAFIRMRQAQAMPNYARGDWLVDAFGNNVSKLTPLLSGDTYASTVQSHILETLADRDPDTLKWRPFIAESWTIKDNLPEWEKYALPVIEKLKAGGADEDKITQTLRDDPKCPPAAIIDFKLRRDVVFADRAPLTAEDVKFTFDFTMDPRIAAPRDQAFLKRIKAVEKLGDFEVRFIFTEPYYAAFELAASISIMPKHFYGKYLASQEAAQEFNQSVGLLMGSGPYRLESPSNWKPGAEIRLIRNVNYWGVGPAFENVVYKEISNDVAHLTAFRNGEIDLFAAAPQQYGDMLKDARIMDRANNYEYLSPLGGYRYIAWNEQDKNGKPTIFADKRVRQALTMLLDREQMIKEVMLDKAVLSTGPFSPLSRQSNPDIKPWPKDIARAKALFTAAGLTDKNNDRELELPDGSPFRIKLTYPSGSSNYEKMVLFVKDAFAAGGVRLDPDPQEWAAFTDLLGHKDFQAISLGWSAGVESDIYQMFHSSQMLAGGDDFMSYKNPELDEILSRARSTVDEDKRMALWRRAHAILHEDQPYTFLWFSKSMRFVDKRIDNVLMTKLGMNTSWEWFVPREKQKWAK